MSRRRFLGALALVLAMLAPASVAGAQSPDDGLPADPYERLAELERRIDRAKEEQANLVPSLDESDRRVAALNVVVAEFEKQKAVLDVDLAKAEGELSKTTESLNEAVANERAALNRLNTVRARARDRVIALYKGGAGAMIEAVLGSEDMRQVDARFDYVKSIMQSDRELADNIRVAADDYEVEVADLERVRILQQKDLDKVATAQAKVAANLDAQSRARDAAAAEAGLKRDKLAQIESDRAAWEQLLEQERQDLLRVTLLLGDFASGPIPENVIAGFLTPPLGGTIVSPFGYRVHPIFGGTRFHAGIDIDAPYGVEIHAAAEGTVVEAGWMGGYGNAVVVDHGGNLATLYAHASELVVSAGQHVQRGDVLAYVGSTGYSTGPHLHFEVRVGGEPVDPVPWLGL